MKIPCYETKRSNKKLDSLDNFWSSSVGESSTISEESKREHVSFVILGVLATGSADDRITFLTPPPSKCPWGPFDVEIGMLCGQFKQFCI